MRIKWDGTDKALREITLLVNKEVRIENYKLIIGDKVFKKGDYIN